MSNPKTSALALSKEYLKGDSDLALRVREGFRAGFLEGHEHGVDDGYKEGYEAAKRHAMMGVLDKSKLDKLIETLEWYAEPSNTVVSQNQRMINDGRTMEVTWKDIGERARKALEEFRK